MCNTTFRTIVLSVLLVSFPVTLYSSDSNEGIALEGEYVGSAQPSVEQGKYQGASVPAYKDLPVIGKGLAEKIASMGSGESLRVIIFLAYQPQEEFSELVMAGYATEFGQLNADTKAIIGRYAQKRDTQAQSDSENYRDEILAMSSADIASMRAINEDKESLALAIKNEIASILSDELGDYQQSVTEAIENLGGVVEFATIAGNALIAVVPTGIVEQIAAIEKVARVVADGKMEANLDIADNATLVTWGGSGLWDHGYDGGLFDPAVLDTGSDLDHPALEDSASPLRDNFYSYYLVAAYADPYWDDVVSEDDMQGHGTHVMGIVASYDTTYTGMAYGVEKAVTLKAGFRKTSGGGSMYHSDAMYLVDRALYHDEDLRPFGTFNDEVDGINLSFGGDTSSDETDYSRFWDSVISSYPDLPVTISAGNSGPSNTYFCTPACSYNAITVANVQDQNTETRDDDIIRFDSTRGPTENGRRKPDIAAPGTWIYSCNNNWESQSDFISKSGTSMAAPMVLGICMDLMDAGVTDELEIKALLVNTAQKNEAGINFESDTDGWSEAFGWGYMNAWAAYYHRNDVITDSVTESGQSGDYKLYQGQMRDEGSGEGRDRVTMAWNRHATYNPHAYPGTYYTLSDLDLRLYDETVGSTIDYDNTSYDNVHQVRVNSGVGMTDVVAKVYAYSSNFAHGGTTETYALATEENFSAVDLPGTFGGIGSWPSEMEPGEQKEFEFWLRNDSDIASHNNQFDLILPTGWSRISGSDPYSAGSIAGGGGYSPHATWMLQAQNTEQDGVNVVSQHTHGSYGESWGPFNWNMHLNIRWDNTAPTPDPMTWQTEPYETSTSSISMTATTATDLHGPVEYYFWAWTSPTGGTGQTHSDWITSTSYTDSGLDANHQYRYDVQARDSAVAHNQTGWSAVINQYTDIETPSGITYGTKTTNSIQARSTNTPSGLDRGSSGLWVECYLNDDSGWKQNNNYWTQSGLDVNEQYWFRAKARNGDADETSFCSWDGVYTLANVPAAPTVDNPTQTTLDVTINVNGNPTHTEFCIYVYDNGASSYYYLDASGGDNGGTPVWQTASAWATVTAVGLTPDTHYRFWTGARNGDGVLTSWSNYTDGYTDEYTWSITVTAPNGGQTWGPGEYRTINWTSEYVTGNVKIEISRSSGASWAPIVDETSNDGSFVWPVTGPGSTLCRVRVSSVVNSSCADMSDGDFTIIPSEPDNPNPSDGADGVSVHTNLSWNNSPPPRGGGATAGQSDGVKAPAIPVDTGGKGISSTDPRPTDSASKAGYPNKASNDVLAAVNSIISQSSGLDWTIEASTAGAIAASDKGDKAAASTYTQGVEIASVRTAGDAGVPAAASLNVAICYADSLAYAEDIQDKLLSTGQFSSVSLVNVNLATPSLAALQAFDAVIVYNDYVYHDSASLGDVMADYVDGGGGVVCMMFENVTYSPMQGRWDSEEYFAIPRSAYQSGPQSYLGTVYDAGHPIMDGVATFDGGSSSYRTSTLDICAGSVRIADWSDGKPLVVTKVIGDVKRVDLAFFPVSSDIGGAGFWNSTTDGAILMANALTWVTGAAAEDVAIFQDSNPWGNTYNQDILTANGFSWVIFETSDMGVVDLSPYKKVIISSGQVESFYDALELNAAWFENYVANGGNLDLHLAAGYQQYVVDKVMPGNFVVAEASSDDVTIVDISHPVITQPHQMTDVDLDGWSYSSHGYFGPIPYGAHEIIREEAVGQPCCMDMPFGTGRILATVQPVEWNYASYNYLENTILCGLADETTYDVYFDTVTPPTTQIYEDLSVPMCDPTPLMGTWLDSCQMYYWKVVAKNSQSAEISGPVWSFKTEILGDISGNSYVDLTDYAALSLYWQDTNCGLSVPCSQADLNRDGKVDLLDLCIYAEHWLENCPAI